MKHFDVGDRIKLTKDAQESLFTKRTRFIYGTVMEIVNGGEQIRVRRESCMRLYQGHEATLWHNSWWRKVK